MRRYKIRRLKRPEQEVGVEILHLSLPGLFAAGQTLVVNRQMRTLCLLSDSPRIILEQLLSENEMRLMLPILQSYPHYCPYEVLLAHISSNVVTDATIERCRLRLQEAQSRGAWQQELRPIRRALSSLRSKLHAFHLEISNVRERGCSLTGLAPPSISAHAQ